MTRRMFIMMWLTIVCTLTFAAAGPACADERAELQQRFKERYPVLAGLKKVEKVGETYLGGAEAVKVEYLDLKANPDDDKSPTIRAFLAEENKDRARLYELIAEETKTTADTVARRNAVRNFDKAGPEEYLKPETGDWVKKKDLKKPE